MFHKVESTDSMTKLHIWERFEGCQIPKFRSRSNPKYLSAFKVCLWWRNSRLTESNNSVPLAGLLPTTNADVSWYERSID